MNTILQKLHPLNHENNTDVLKKAANILKNGGLVAFPTETVYGLGANALNQDYVKKIFLAKGRPSDNPLIVHISNLAQVYQLAKDIPNQAFILMEKFWAGPLTVVLKKSSIIPKVTSGGLDTIAIRMPNNSFARALIDECGFPIAAPSANISGKPSPTSAKHVFNDLNGKIDMILDGGDCDFGLESTVIQVLHDKIIILRPGSITFEMLKEVCYNVFIDNAILQKDFDILPKSPGMKYKHYSPSGQITIFKGDFEDISKKILCFLKQDSDNSIAILTDEMIKKNVDFNNFKILNIGSIKNQYEIGKNLFAILRECDNLNVKNIYIPYFEEHGLGFAIMNRLKKAAGFNIINL